MPLRHVILFLCLTTVALSEQSESSKLALDAAQAANIFSTGKPLRLVARIRVQAQNSVTGAYALFSNGTDAFRDEIKLGDYSETRIGVADTIYRYRASKVPTNEYFARIVRDMVNVPGSLLDAGYLASSKPRKQKIDGRELTCFDTQREDVPGPAFCLDSSGRLASFTDKTYAMDPLIVRFSEYSTFRDKWYPRFMEFRTKEMAATAEVASLEDAPAPDERFFQHDDRFTKEDGCLLQKPPLFVRRGAGYASIVKQIGGGPVTVHFTIGADGVVHDAEALDGKIPLKPLAVEYIKTFRYRPSECNGHPVTVDRTIHVVYDIYGIVR